MGEGNLNITEPEDSINEYCSQHIMPLHNTYFKADISLVFWKKEIRPISKNWLKYWLFLMGH